VLELPAPVYPKAAASSLIELSRIDILA
jgi:hypothetical protein